MSIDNDIRQLKEEAQAKLAEADRLSQLKELFPDITKWAGPWKGSAIYCSKSINTQATNWLRHHTCGCCADTHLEVWPYINSPEGTIYSDPPVFVVGRKCGLGDRPSKNWEDALRKAGIAELIITEVQKYFESCQEYLKPELSFEED